jgi:hypothetical protein
MSRRYPNDWSDLVEHIGIGTAFGVVMAWFTLAVGGRWRPERSWHDRAGRVLGCYLILGFLFAWFIAPGL